MKKNAGSGVGSRKTQNIPVMGELDFPTTKGWSWSQAELQVAEYHLPSGGVLQKYLFLTYSMKPEITKPGKNLFLHSPENAKPLGEKKKPRG